MWGIVASDVSTAITSWGGTSRDRDTHSQISTIAFKEGAYAVMPEERKKHYNFQFSLVFDPQEFRLSIQIEFHSFQCDSVVTEPNAVLTPWWRDGREWKELTVHISSQQLGRLKDCQVACVKVKNTIHWKCNTAWHLGLICRVMALDGLTISGCLLRPSSVLTWSRTFWTFSLVINYNLAADMNAIHDIYCNSHKTWTQHRVYREIPGSTDWQVSHIITIISSGWCLSHLNSNWSSDPLTNFDSLLPSDSL